MNVHAKFIGGNINVVRVEEPDVYLQNEIRGTSEDWFYWAFCVEGAQGRTLTFHFDKDWIGYYGPAVSHDLYSWNWLEDQTTGRASSSFTYTFTQDETCVYFAHNMLYHPKHFEEYCKVLSLEQLTLCHSEQGRSVPFVRFGKGTERIILTARHHACESTGNYVIEGVVRELMHEPIPNLEVIVCPFMDFDGVLDGDQGKSRTPHDHNRDYPLEGDSIYATVRALRRLAMEKRVRYAFDFHSPWHVGGMNDWVFIVEKHYEATKNISRFGNLWDKATTQESLPYDVTGTLPPETDWNKGPASTCSNYMRLVAGAELSFTVETPYFSCSGIPFNADGAREMGRCFAVALRQYHDRPAKISFTGDILYNNPMNSWCRTEEGYDYLPLFKRVWSRLSDADYLIGNIESPFAGEDNEGYTHNRWCFNTPEAALEALKMTGFDLLSLANNHAMDRKQAGILATLDACDQVGLDHVGLYRSRVESEAVFVRTIGGIRVGFVNATYGTNAFAHHHFLGSDEKYMVTLTQPEETLDGSIHLLLSPEEIEEQTKSLYGDELHPLVAEYLENVEIKIRQTKAKSDFVVMLLHSGGQYNTDPDAYTRMLVERLWDYGVDIIVGNHPHVIHTSQLKGDRFTAFSLGNIMCSEADSSKAGHFLNSDYSAVLNMTLERTGDDAIEKHLSFRLFQIMHDPDRKKAPWTVDTYDQWRADPYDSYKETILFYANHFMPGMNYSEPMVEYPIC